MIVRWIKQFFGTLAALIVGLLFLSRKRDPEVVEEGKKAIKESRVTAGEILDRQKARKEKAEKMKAGLLVLLVCGLVFAGARAAQAEIYIPATYDEAVEYYLAALELYEGAEADVDRLLAENNRLTVALENMVQYRQPRWNLFTGVFITSGAPGIYLGLNYSF